MLQSRSTLGLYVQYCLVVITFGQSLDKCELETSRFRGWMSVLALKWLEYNKVIGMSAVFSRLQTFSFQSNSSFLFYYIEKVLPLKHNICKVSFSFCSWGHSCEVHSNWQRASKKVSISHSSAALICEKPHIVRLHASMCSLASYITLSWVISKIQIDTLSHHSLLRLGSDKSFGSIDVIWTTVEILPVKQELIV